MDDSDRLLLYLDILGFTTLVEEKSPQEVGAIVKAAVNEALSASSGTVLRALHFSDTIILYQQKPGRYLEYYNDTIHIAARLVTALLSRRIPVRGVLVRGAFTVERDESDRFDLFFGRALIEAYKAEQAEQFVGVTIRPSAWSPFVPKPEGLAILRYGIARGDGVVLMNPISAIWGMREQDARGWVSLTSSDTTPNEEKYYDVPQLQALGFVLDEANRFAAAGDFSSRVACKYHTTVAFFRMLLGPRIFQDIELAAADYRDWQRPALD